MAVNYKAISSVTWWSFTNSSQSVTLPSRAAGDLLVCLFWGVDDSGTPSASSGWNLLGNSASWGQGYQMFIWWRIATNTSADNLSISPANGGAVSEAVVLSFTGHDPTTPFLGSGTGFDFATYGSGGSATRAHPSLTPSIAGCGLVLWRTQVLTGGNSTFTCTVESASSPAGVERLEAGGLGNWLDQGVWTRDGDFGTSAQSYTSTATDGSDAKGTATILIQPAPTSTPVDLGGGTSTSSSSASGALTRSHAEALTGTLLSTSSVADATLTVEGHARLLGTISSVSSASASALSVLNHGWLLEGAVASTSSASGALSVARNHQIHGTAISVSSLLGQLSQGRNNQITATSFSSSSASATLHIKQPPPYADYEFLIDWDRDNGLRISDFETGFDGWEPTDLLSLSTDHSYTGRSSLKASWQNQTPSPNDDDTFVFGDPDLGFDTGLFAITSEDPADDEVLSITYALSNLRVGEPYTLSMWVFVPASNGQHVSVGIRDLAASDATDETEKWLKLVVPFTPTSTEHTLFIDASGDVTDGNFTYIDYVFVTGEFEDISERVRIDDVSWSYGRDQSRALNPVTPAEADIVVDNQDGFLSPNNTGSPLHDYLLPNRELLVRATFRSHTYDLLRVYLDDIQEDPYITEQEVKFSAVDPLASIAGGQLSTQVWLGCRTGDAINHVLDEIGWPENRRDIDPGATVISHFWVEGQDASDAITDLVASEGPPAYATVSDAGYFIFRDRHHRIVRDESNTVQATFNPTGTEPCFSPPAEINIGWKDIVNSVTFAINERSTIVTENEEGSMGEAPTVWKYEGTFSVPAGESRTFHVTSETPVLFFQAPTLRKGDYTVAGGDVQFTLSRTSGETTELTVLAPTQDVAVTNLIVRGYPINTVDGISITVQDENSIAQVGPKADTENVEAPWANANDAQAIGDIITRTRGRRLPTMSITLNNGTPERLLEIFKRRLSDLVHIIEPRSFTHHDFYIESIEHTISDGGKLHTTKFGCEMVPDIIEPEDETLTPFTFGDEYAGFDSGVFAYDTIQADPDKVFILDVSELDSDDGLGF